MIRQVVAGIVGVDVRGYGRTYWQDLARAKGTRRHSWTLPATFPFVVGLYTPLAWMKRDQTQHASGVDDTLPSQHRVLGVGHFKRAQVDHSSLAPRL